MCSCIIFSPSSISEVLRRNTARFALPLVYATHLRSFELLHMLSISLLLLFLCESRIILPPQSPHSRFLPSFVFAALIATYRAYVATTLLKVSMTRSRSLNVTRILWNKMTKNTNHGHYIHLTFQRAFIGATN